MDPGMTETENARVADEWLKSESWETYPEVVLGNFPGRPDLIAARRGICQVLECKRSLNLSVVEQAARWRLYQRDDQDGMPHLIWVVVGRSRSRHSELLDRFMGEFGIGLIEIDKTPAYESRYGGEVEIAPQRYALNRLRCPRIQPGARRTASRLIERLNPDMRIATPGAKGGATEYMTPFKRTMQAVERYLASDPSKERHINHIIEHLNKNGGHHYGSDRSARGAIPPHLDRLGYPRTREWGCWFGAKDGKDGAA